MNETNKIILGFLGGVIFFAGLVYVLIHAPECLEDKTEMVHHDAYTSYMMIGDVWYPQFHSAYDAMETHCIKWDKWKF